MSLLCGFVTYDCCGGPESSRPNEFDEANHDEILRSMINEEKSARKNTIRVVVVGSSDRKLEIIESLKEGTLTGEGEVVIRSWHERFEPRPAAKRDDIVFTAIPTRDLTHPRVYAEFQTYLARATCVVVAVDDSSTDWRQDAGKWVDLVKDAKERVIVALLISASHDTTQKHDGALSMELSEDECRLACQSHDFIADRPGEVVGWFRHHPHDEAADECHICVDTLVRHVDHVRAHEKTSPCPFL